MRRWRWALVVLGLVVLWFGDRVYNHRPRLSLAQEAEAVSARLAADPATAGAEAEMWAAYRELMAVSLAPDEAARSQEIWLEGRVDSGGRPDPVPAAGVHAAALRRQIGFWRQAVGARLGAEELGRHCVYQAPYSSCRVGAAGEVAGSGGALRYQMALRFMTAAEGADAQAMTEDDYAAVSQDGMIGSLVQVFAAAPEGGWRLVMAGSGSEGAVPEAVETPAGRMLRWTEGPSEDPALHVVWDGKWWWVDQSPWKRALAGLAPAGTCMRRIFYAGQWPFPQVVFAALSRRMVPDLGALTYDDRYWDGSTEVGRVHAVLAMEGRRLVLRSAAVTVVGRASVWARLFGRCG